MRKSKRHNLHGIKGVKRAIMWLSEQQEGSSKPQRLNTSSRIPKPYKHCLSPLSSYYAKIAVFNIERTPELYMTLLA